MTKKTIKCLWVEDEDGKSDILFSIVSGERPNEDVVRKHIYQFLGDFQQDGDEACYEIVVSQLCQEHAVEMFGYEFYFEETILYEN